MAKDRIFQIMSMTAGDGRTMMLVEEGRLALTDGSICGSRARR
jgi:hypothetical protein